MGHVKEDLVTLTGDIIKHLNTLEEMNSYVPTFLVLTIRKGIKTKSSSSTEDTVYLVVLNGHFIFRTPTAKLDV